MKMWEELVLALAITTITMLDSHPLVRFWFFISCWSLFSVHALSKYPTDEETQIIGAITKIPTFEIKPTG